MSKSEERGRLSEKAASEFGLWPLPDNELPTVNWVENDRTNSGNPPCVRSPSILAA